MTYLYRYRSAKAVLEQFEELDKQEIYFSSIDELNDPMEGYKDLFWSGDEIVWRALLKHYVFCLLDTTCHTLLMGPEFDAKYVGSIALCAPESLPDAPIKNIYKRVSAKFLANPAVEAFLSVVVSRKDPIRRNELTHYLRALHPLILAPIISDLHSEGLWPGFIPPPQIQQETACRNATQFFEAVANLRPEEPHHASFSEAMFSATESTFEQVQLIAEVDLSP